MFKLSSLVHAIVIWHVIVIVAGCRWIMLPDLGRKKLVPFSGDVF